MPDPYWNHNVHYHPVVLAAVPDGCGDGLLARKLAAGTGSVTGMDRSPEMIRLARESAEGLGNVTFLEGDYLDAPRLPDETYGFVSAVAVVHHSEFEHAVGRLVRLLAPGGRLVIVGLARDRAPLDWVIGALGVPANLFHRSRRNEGGPAGMPIEDSTMSWSEVRQAAHRLLPGCRFRRRLLWRYTLVWDKPQEGGP
ncbi:SAM-dependent methyltransferase [Streptomyces sp. MMG1533]|uniref:class I SAM-dependent methyltransferase n=1 Tax=Streptomyces sp. MMG1533 TaxID=1415546 RepID=UPI0006AD9C12|nr:class I SAM-dependent methyltransferase [Streptomyces sp. MMG1533]KOU67637.1 SAM-dependent methyltransferase [Streptomyces sp. MMG1533]